MLLASFMCLHAHPSSLLKLKELKPKASALVLVLVPLLQVLQS
jgi:hypothetical protein